MKQLTQLSIRCWRRIAPYQKQLTPAVVLVLLGLVATSPLCAAGFDWSDFKVFGGSIKDFVLYAGALFGLVGIVFGIVKCIGRDWTEGILAAAAGGAVLWFSGQALGWTTAITGQSL